MRALRPLGKRECAVVALRYGLLDGVPRTLEEISRSYGVSRERIRQIEAKTLQKLRSAREAEGLHELLE